MGEEIATVHSLRTWYNGLNEDFYSCFSYHRMKSDRLRSSWLFLILLAGGVAFLVAHRMTAASHVKGQYFTPSATSPIADLPVTFHSRPGIHQFSFSLQIYRYSPRRYSFIPDDSLLNLTVNGVALPEVSERKCSYPRGCELDLSDYIRNGENEIRGEILNRSGGSALYIFPAERSPVVTTLLPAILLLLLVATLLFFRRLAPESSRYITFVFLLGAVLRVSYFLFTPYGVREYDHLGHLEYVLLLLEHQGIPRPDACWSCYHPPLYYFLCAFWIQLTHTTGDLTATMLLEFRAFSLLISLATLIVGFLIGDRLFGKHSEPRKKLAFCSILAVFPGLIFFAPRLNNDVLIALFSFLAIYFLIIWWDRGTPRSFIAAVAFIALGTVSKSNILIFAPICLLLLVFQNRCSITRKVLSGFSGTLVFLGLAGIPLLYRAARIGSGPFYSNIQWIRKDLHLPNHWIELVTFHPAALLKLVFNNPYSVESRREHLWEFFLRSALFGEYDFGASFFLFCGVILAAMLCLILIGAFGFYRSLRRAPKTWCAQACILIISLLSVLVYRWYAPFPSSQDFRYVPWILVPFAFSIAEALHDTRPALNAFIVFVLAVFSLGSTLLVIMVPFA